jgi:hypothetical protein
LPVATALAQAAIIWTGKACFRAAVAGTVSASLAFVAVGCAGEAILPPLGLTRAVATHLAAIAVLRAAAATLGGAAHAVAARFAQPAIARAGRACLAGTAAVVTAALADAAVFRAAAA